MVPIRYLPRSTEQPLLRVWLTSRQWVMTLSSPLRTFLLRQMGSQMQTYLLEHQTAKPTILGDRVWTLRYWATVSHYVEIQLCFY